MVCRALAFFDFALQTGEVSLLDPDALYAKNIELFHSPGLRGLNLVMGFTGFADAGHVVRQITAELLDNLESERVAVFDADQLPAPGAQL